MADINDLILQNLKELHRDVTASRHEMNTHFRLLNGRVRDLEDLDLSETAKLVKVHDKTLTKLKGGVGALTGLGVILTFFHEKWDSLLALLKLAK